MSAAWDGRTHWLPAKAVRTFVLCERRVVDVSAWGVRWVKLACTASMLGICASETCNTAMYNRLFFQDVDSRILRTYELKKGPLTLLSDAQGLCTYLLKICVTENQGKRGVEILGSKQIKDCLGICGPVCKSEIVYCEVISLKQLFTIACCTSSTRFSERKSR